MRASIQSVRKIPDRFSRRTESGSCCCNGGRDDVSGIPSKVSRDTRNPASSGSSGRSRNYRSGIACSTSTADRRPVTGPGIRGCIPRGCTRERTCRDGSRLTESWGSRRDSAGLGSDRRSGDAGGRSGTLRDTSGITRRNIVEVTDSSGTYRVCRETGSQIRIRIGTTVGSRVSDYAGGVRIGRRDSDGRTSRTTSRSGLSVLRSEITNFFSCIYHPISTPSWNNGNTFVIDMNR